MTGSEGGQGRRAAVERLIEVDELEVRIDRLVTGGDGLGWWRGIPIFVPRTAPGDRARVRVSERRPGYGRAELVELLEEGPGRISPRCRHFADCGGCDLQHLEAGRQTRYKVEAARETLRRLGGLSLPPDQEEVVRGDPWGYRLRTQLQVAASEEGVEVGYFARRSHRLVAIQECPVLVPELERFVTGLGRSLATDSPRRIDVAVGESGAPTCAPILETLPRGEVAMTAGSYILDFDARTFFQCNRALLETLQDRAVGEWSGDLAYDLYAGVGLFALPLAARYRRVVAVDGDRVAARYLRRNARKARLAGLETVHAAVESAAADLATGIDRVLVDPPRAGLSSSVVRRLLAAAPQRLTYVSCHEATLARDLKKLGRRYEVESLIFVDLFPQTGHLETVAQLALAPSSD